MDIDKALSFESSQQWRKWLQGNAHRAKEVWLVHYKKKSGKISVSLSAAVEEALCFGWIDGKLKSIDGERFITRYTPRKAGSVWSRINRERAEKLVAAGRMTATGLARIEEAKQNGYWDAAYTNKIRDELPADLKEALMEYPQARSNFEKFANSYRNMYIGWITGARTEETRKKRIMEVVRRSALNKKPGIE